MRIPRCLTSTKYSRNESCILLFEELFVYVIAQSSVSVASILELRTRHVVSDFRKLKYMKSGITSNGITFILNLAKIGEAV